MCTLRAPPFYRYWFHCYTLCIVTASPPLSRSTDPRAAYHPSQPLQRHSALFSLSILQFVATARFSFSSFFFFRSLFVIFLFFSFRATRKTPAANVFIANLQFPLHKIRAHHPYFSLSLSLLPLIFKGLADDSMQFISTKAPVKFNIGRRYVEEIRVSSSPFRPFQ